MSPVELLDDLLSGYKKAKFIIKTEAKAEIMFTYNDNHIKAHKSMPNCKDNPFPEDLISKVNAMLAGFVNSGILKGIIFICILLKQV
jgi:hypothetical protein